MNLSNMSTEEIKAECKKISHQISELQITLREIEKIERERIIENLKQYVGKCYAVRPYKAPPTSAPVRYIKIVDIPIEQHTMTTTIFNENQLPAFSFWVKDQDNILKLCSHYKRVDLNERELGFDFAPAFLSSITKKHTFYDDSYEEITPEEFNKALEKHLKCLYNAVTCI